MCKKYKGGGAVEGKAKSFLFVVGRATLSFRAYTSTQRLLLDMGFNEFYGSGGGGTIVSQLF